MCVVWYCGVLIFRNWLFISIRLFLVGTTWCIWYLCVFWSICRILRSENRPFFIIVLTWSASLWLVWKLAHSFQLVIPSLALSRMSGSSIFESVLDWWKMVAQLLLCGVLPPGIVQYCLQHSCVISVKLFLHTFS